MGSDMHLSPPSPDEHRIVRSGGSTAVYSRHTDEIYGDTKTWTRIHFIADPTGAAFETLKATQKSWKVKELYDYDFPSSEAYRALADADRDWSAEEDMLRQAVIRTREKLTSAHEDFIQATDAFGKFLEERREAEK